jgi:hypothetical protein
MYIRINIIKIISLNLVKIVFNLKKIFLIKVKNLTNLTETIINLCQKIINSILIRLKPMGTKIW